MTETLTISIQELSQILQQLKDIARQKDLDFYEEPLVISKLVNGFDEKLTVSQNGERIFGIKN